MSSIGLFRTMLLACHSANVLALPALLVNWIELNVTYLLAASIQSKSNPNSD